MEATLGENLKNTAKAHKKKLLFAFFFETASTILMFLIPFLFREFSRAILSEWNIETLFFLKWFKEIFGTGVSARTIFACVLVVIAFLSAYFKYLGASYFLVIGCELERKTRNKLVESINQKNAPFFDHYPTGHLLSVIVTDIWAYSEVFAIGVMYPLYASTLLITVIAALFWLSPVMAMIAIVPLLAIPITFYLFNEYYYKKSMEIKKMNSKIMTATQETFTGIKIIKDYNQETDSLIYFSDLSNKLLTKTIHLFWIQKAILPFLNFLGRTAIILMLGAYVLSSAYHYQEILGTDFVTFVWITSYGYLAMNLLGVVLPIIQIGRTSYDRILEINDSPLGVFEEGTVNTPIIPEMGITVEGLHYTFPEHETAVLKDIAFELKGPGMYCFTGPTGSGKSTLCKLLNRDYLPPPKTVFYGKNDLLQYNEKTFRDHVIYLGQKSMLFTGTIQENIAFSEEQATREEVEEVSHTADFYHTVMSFPTTWETPVSEKGASLSGGQKKRITIARGLLQKRSIFFLDNILVGLDTETAIRVFKNLKKLLANKLVIFVTNFPFVLKHSDKIFFIEDGKIEASGSHEELMSQEGSYNAMMSLLELERQYHER